MGYVKFTESLQFLQKIIKKEKIVLPGLKVVELGNQWLWEIFNGQNIPTKIIFEFFGVEYTSIDINGDDGAVMLDLRLDIPKKYKKRYELLTNIGTTEHVEDNQYQCWKNIHNLCKTNALMIHSLPLRGHWEGHCKWYYYPEWFEDLAEKCNYEVVELELDKKSPKLYQVSTCLRKTKYSKFLNSNEFIQPYNITE